MEDHFCSLVVEVLPCSVVLYGFKWARRFGRFLQLMSGLKVLACTLTDLNYVTTMLQSRPFLNH